MKSIEFINEAFTNPYPLKNINNSVVFDLSDSITSNRKGHGAQAEWITDDGVKYQAHAFQIGLTKAQRDKKAAVQKARQDKIDKGIKPKRTLPRLSGIASSNGGIWEIHFDAEKKLHKIGPKDGNDYATTRTADITGSGDAFRVFATMFEFIEYIVRRA